MIREPSHVVCRRALAVRTVTRLRQHMHLGPIDRAVQSVELARFGSRIAGAVEKHASLAP